MLLLVYRCYYWCNSFNLKLLFLKSDFTLTLLVYLKPALKNKALKFELLLSYYLTCIKIINIIHAIN